MTAGPHIPMTTSAGHFLSMQPAQGVEPRSAVWYRGDEVDAIAAGRAKYRQACESVLEIFGDSSQSLESLDTQLKILEIVERALK